MKIDEAAAGDEYLHRFCPYLIFDINKKIISIIEEWMIIWNIRNRHSGSRRKI